nr:uncharacterized protein LOC117862074 [Setaria viridis]
MEQASSKPEVTMGGGRRGRRGAVRPRAAAGLCPSTTTRRRLLWSCASSPWTTAPSTAPSSPRCSSAPITAVDSGKRALEILGSDHDDQDEYAITWRRWRGWREALQSWLLETWCKDRRRYCSEESRVWLKNPEKPKASNSMVQLLSLVN